MSLPKMTTAVNNISQLDTRPNAVNGLTADELKAEFDKGPEAIKKFLNEVLIPALDGAITLDALGAVPETRKVNGQALSADVTVSAEDVPAFGPDQLKRTTQYLLDELAIDVSKAVPKTRRVAGKTLDADIALAAEDVGYSKTVGGVTVEGTVKTELNSLNAAMGGKVPTTRKVNGKPLSADVTLGAAAIDYAGAIPGAANVKEALEALNTKKDVAVFSATLSGETLSSAATFPEISAAYSAGKQVLLKVLASGGAYWLLPLVRLLGGMVASFAAWVSNSRLAVATLNYSAASTPPVNAWSLTQVPLSAESVAYSGKVGSDTVANVKAALDALSEQPGVPGPKGDKGDPGETGPQGPQGENGESAYAAAVRGGYEGSEADFIADIANAAAAVPQTRTVNGKALSADVILGAADVGYNGKIPGVVNVKAALDELTQSFLGMEKMLLPTWTASDKGKALMIGSGGSPAWKSLPTYDGGVS
mgnify:CR=1 FL=1|nr:MAG TPA: nucleoid-associated protein [Caudoviricetes sp.]